MSGEEPDVARARAVLAEMQDRVGHGPYATLGLAPHATSADLRAAFLRLVKTYHPARFGRMPTDVQRLATEVFLALRGAHDALAKQLRATPAVRAPTAQSSPVARPPGGKSPTGQVPVVAPPRTQTGPQPTVKPPVPAGAAIAMPRRTPTASPAPRTPTPALGVRSVGAPAAPASAAGSGAMPALDKDLATVYELMKAGQWDQARAQISVLAARHANAPKYRALLCYTRGREAQLERRLDEARVELDTALQLDPDLQLAKTALAELFTRRK